MKSDLKVARKYASALFESLQPDQYDGAISGLSTFANAYSESVVLRNILSNPSLKISERRDVISDLVKLAGIKQEQVQSFVQIIFEGQRLDSLLAIVQEFEAKVRAYRNLLKVEVSSARLVSEQERSAIADKLKKEFGQELTVEWSVSPDLIAGYCVKVGDRILNCSVSGALKQMENFLIR